MVRGVIEIKIKELRTFHVVGCLSGVALLKFPRTDAGVLDVAVDPHETTALIGNGLEEGRATGTRTAQHQHHLAWAYSAIEGMQDRLGSSAWSTHEALSHVIR
jgi:hypothetical protein